MKIYDYIESNINNNPFIKTELIGTFVNNPISSENFQNLLRNFIYDNFGYYEISEKIKNTERKNKTMLEVIQEIASNIYLSNEYRYDTLYSTIIQEYNPIENYSMTEKIETNYNGKEINATTFTGSEKEIHSIKENHTEHSQTNEGGTTNVLKTAPYDSENFFNKEQSTTTQDSPTSSELTIGNTGENTTEKTFNNRSDNNVKSFEGRNDVVTHTRSGNIGVTTSQQMLESQRALANFNFVSIVARDIVKRIGILIY